MPQPALHLLLACETLNRWHASSAPFDLHNATAVNAFLHGSLAPDMGNFPGGSRELAHLVHTRRTGELQRALLEFARTTEQQAFAWGWLTHVLGDAIIHPIINEEAARRSHDGGTNLVEHVRVEVGIDVWFCWQHPALDGLRLRPAFDRHGYRFLAGALDAVLNAGVTAAQLTQMERGLVMFGHGALHFATSVARQLCWRDAIAENLPLGSALLWHTASCLSPRNSVVYAYLNPHVPGHRLVRQVEEALPRFHTMLDAVVADGAQTLPDYNLEDGTIEVDGERYVA